MVEPFGSDMKKLKAAGVQKNASLVLVAHHIRSPSSIGSIPPTVGKIGRLY